jgi:hypothetical protein
MGQPAEDRLPNPGRRRDDREGFLKLVDKFARYQWLWTTVILLVIAVGFDFQTPSAKFELIEKKVEANRAERQQGLQEINIRVDTLTDNVDDIKQLLEIIAIDVCLRRASDPFARSRLRCDVILRRP